VLPEKRVRERAQRQTLPEELLWQILRDRQLGEYKFRRQHPLGRYIADFCCAEAKLIIEIDREIPDECDQQAYDHLHDEALQAKGVHTLRLPNRIIQETPEQAIQIIVHALPPLHCRERG
jgi:very-short-patch-repair endonuclease